MIRGTTPTITVSVEQDLTGYDCYMTFEHSRGQLTKSGADLSVTCGTTSTVACTLTQAETLAFPEGGYVKVQVRAIDGNGNVIATEVDEDAVFEVGEVLLEEVIQ